MKQRHFIFVIDAELHYNVLVRIMVIFNRPRIPIRELSSHVRHGEDQLRITVAIEDTKENAVKLSKKLDKEVDIQTVTLYEQSENLAT